MSTISIPQVAGAQGAARHEGWLAALVLAAPIVPAGAAVLTITLLGAAPLHQAIVLGLAGALVAWLALALLARPFTRISHANSAVFHELRARCDALAARLEAVQGTSGPGAYQEARAHCAFVAERLSPADGQPGAGLEWLAADGYLDLWNRIHRAEEALLLLEAPEYLAGRVVYEESRLGGSTISNREQLLALLGQVRRQLRHPPAGAAQTPPAPGALPDSDLEEARATLSTVSRIMSQFRGDRWDALLRARNQLQISGLFTAVVAYALLLVAVAAGTAREQLEAAAVYFLVGGCVALFTRLMADARSQRSVEDYGLAVARLTYTPLFGGLAAVGGVVLVACMPSAAGAAGAAPDLGAVFDLTANPAAVLTAALFGVAPRLLLERLQAQVGQVEQVAEDLQKSEASSARA